MQRYNSFTLIHKALRAMLYDTALTIQQTSFANNDESELALDKIENVLFLFEQHAHHEDTFVNPAVEVFEPGVGKAFEKEHVEDLRLSNQLKNLLNIYRNANFTDEKIISGSAIAKSFIEFMIFNLQHMAKEEILLNEALWKHYTDEQIMSISQKIIASIPQEELTIAYKWMVRGINNFDAVNWLKGIKLNAPAFVFEAILDVARKELPENRFEIIMEALEQGVAIV